MNKGGGGRLMNKVGGGKLLNKVVGIKGIFFRNNLCIFLIFFDPPSFVATPINKNFFPTHKDVSFSAQKANMFSNRFKFLLCYPY